jgi:type IV pilus assembly protein PilA
LYFQFVGTQPASTFLANGLLRRENQFTGVCFNLEWRSIVAIQKKAQQGFTLIELMIVIAIVGILAAIALPAYQDYIVRSKMTEPLAALAEAKTTVAEYVAANAGYPTTDATAFGINTSDRTGQSQITDHLDILALPTANGTIRLVAYVQPKTWGETANTTALAFHLSGSLNGDGTMSWSCLPGEDGNKANAIETKYLPANCRG